MRLTFRAHFDGRFIVPDEKLSLPMNEPMDVQITSTANPEQMLSLDEQKQQAAYDEFLRFAQTHEVPHLTDEAISRESIYEDRL